MSEESSRYKNREIDEKLGVLDSKVETYHQETMKQLDTHSDTHEQILTQVKLTNGKVKKIIIALVAIGAFALGSGAENISTFIKFLV